MVNLFLSFESTKGLSQFIEFFNAAYADLPPKAAYRIEFTEAARRYTAHPCFTLKTDGTEPEELKFNWPPRLDNASCEGG